MTPPSAILLAEALDAVNDAVLVFDGRGTVLHANRGAREAFGKAVPATRSELSQHPLGALAREQPLNGGVVLVIPRSGAAGTLAERERQDIVLALAESGGQLNLTARRLGISRTTLWRRLKQYGLRPPGPARR